MTISINCASHLCLVCTDCNFVCMTSNCGIDTALLRCRKTSGLQERCPAQRRQQQTDAERTLQTSVMDVLTLHAAKRQRSQLDNDLPYLRNAAWRCWAHFVSSKGPLCTVSHTDNPVSPAASPQSDRQTHAQRWLGEKEHTTIHPSIDASTRLEHLPPVAERRANFVS